jgi:hypothetical protein
MRFATVGCLGLIRAPPLSQHEPAAVREFGSVNAGIGTAAPDQDDQPGAKGASTYDIKHQQAPLSH